MSSIISYKQSLDAFAPHIITPYVQERKRYQKFMSYNTHLNNDYLRMGQPPFHVGTKPPIMCGNCGALGHVYKNCNYPITSYGIITVRFVQDPITKQTIPYYLMVQRKDSLSYVEFLRGKYGLENRTYLMKLFSNMTIDERQKLRDKEFDILWKELWQVDECNSYIKEYNESKGKFLMLKKGYYLKNEDNEVNFFNIATILTSTECNLKETEWGFPKGRRNINEDDIVCALREFQEETGIARKHVSIVPDIKPFEEVFSGTNHVRYRHVYYVAVYHDSRPPSPMPVNKTQSKEIRSTNWFTYDDAQANICTFNMERKELFKRVHQIVIKNMLPSCS